MKVCKLERYVLSLARYICILYIDLASCLELARNHYLLQVIFRSINDLINCMPVYKYKVDLGILQANCKITLQDLIKHLVE